MLTTFTDMAPERLLAGDHVPGRGIVATTTTSGDHVVVTFTNGNSARYLTGQRVTVHRTT